MSDQETVAVLGAGNMGTALAHVIAGNRHEVRAWSIEEDVLEEMRERRVNTKYLAGVELHPGIMPVWQLERAVAGAGLVILSVPSSVVPLMAARVAPLLKPGQIVLNTAKGLESGTHRRMSEVIASAAPAVADTAGSMGGPAIAIEMARGLPMAVVVATPDTEASRRLQGILQNDHLKVETLADLVGVELCSALKNIYAIFLGMCDGLCYGTNTKAFLATLALEEMCAIVSTLGGRRDTVFGLAGVGDLLTTGYSEHSRNRALGEKLGSGGDWEAFLRSHTVEGVAACMAVSELVSGKRLPVHLLDTLREVLFEGRPAPDAVPHFLAEFTY